MEGLTGIFEEFIRRAQEATNRGWLKWKLVPEKIRELIEKDEYPPREQRIVVIGTQNKDRVRDITEQLQAYGKQIGLAPTFRVAHTTWDIAYAFFDYWPDYPGGDKTKPSLPSGVIYFDHIQHFKGHSLRDTTLLDQNLPDGWGNPLTLLKKLCKKYDIPLRKFDQTKNIEGIRDLLPSGHH